MEPYDSGEDDGIDAETEVHLARFEAAHKDIDAGWVRLMFHYAWEYEGVDLSTFDGDVLETVLFELFPGKVSCEPSEAPEIVKALTAWWTYARDALRHPDAAGCLAVLGQNAVARLERKLADPANYGMAKSFFMQGRALGYDVDTEEGLSAWVDASNAASMASKAEPARGRNDGAKTKKKLRKLKKKAQRKNRR
jgi:hypothetical protein